ncbi:A/G-specific adenine glycosylase [Haloferula sp.]|uniref:A/G-specific adenine glycosylase n=1 Tax=Haloferula sp. TaxID=2497595 RepID=UPI003C7239B5
MIDCQSGGSRQFAGVLKPALKKDALEDPVGFRRALRAWFEKEGKDYPWRRTRDPYAILVSEVMLQQTQIAAVLGRGFYARFMERFPDTRTLASAEDDVLLKTWEGLGYYRRARMLREAARVVEEQCGGEFPKDHQAVLGLPGVGRYTAGAVMSFAYDEAQPLVDGNVARVLARLMDFSEEIDGGKAQKQLWAWAEELLDRAYPRIYNSALMELGQTFCRTGQPDCLECPVAKFCRTRHPAELPKKAKRVKVTELDEHVVFAERDGCVLLKKLEAGRREGMWRLPERAAAEVADWALLHRRKYGITRYRVTLHVHADEGIEAGEGEVWQPHADVPGLVMPPADRAALAAVTGDAEEIA